jgi:hypothetical protein
MIPRVTLIYVLFNGVVSTAEEFCTSNVINNRRKSDKCFELMAERSDTHSEGPLTVFLTTNLVSRRQVSVAVTAGTFIRFDAWQGHWVSLLRIFLGFIVCRSRFLKIHHGNNLLCISYLYKLTNIITGGTVQSFNTANIEAFHWTRS